MPILRYVIDLKLNSQLALPCKDTDSVCTPISETSYNQAVNITSISRGPKVLYER